MKSTMKLTAKLFLIISLFCTVALAEGDMEGGGFAGDMEGGGFGDMEGGGIKCVECVVDNENDKKDGSIFTIVQDYLENLFG